MTERRFIIITSAILLAVVLFAWLLMSDASGQTTAPTTAVATFDDATGNVVSVTTIPPPRRIPSRPPIVNTPTITLSTASLVFQQATKVPQSVTATGPAGVSIAVHDNLSFVDTGGPTGTGSLTATFTPNASYSTATQSINGSASFTAGTLTAVLPVSLNVGSGTVTPPQNGFGSTQPAIADWDMVQNQTTAGLHAALVAWHVNAAGIGSVDFVLNGAHTVVTAMTANPETGVTEFVGPAIPSTATSISATVYPVVGKATPLTLPLNNPAKLRIVTGLVTPSMVGALASFHSSGGTVWYKSAHLQGNGRGDGVNWDPSDQAADGTFPSRWYVTDSEISDSLDGGRNWRLLRNVNTHRIGSNFFSDSSTAINVTCSDVNPDGINPSNPPHPDVYQGYSTKSNIILYGINATGLDKSRGVSLDEWSYANIALVNVSLSGGAVGSMFDVGSKTNGTMRNILISNLKTVGNHGAWIGSPTWTDVVAEKGSTVPTPVPNGVTQR